MPLQALDGWNKEANGKIKEEWKREEIEDTRRARDIREEEEKSKESKESKGRRARETSDGDK